MKNKLFDIANMPKCGYSSLALGKISKLALVGYDSNGVQSAYRAFFVRYFSMRSHVMVKLERDTFECVGIRLNLSTNPFQFCHPHFNELGETSIQSIGVHHHA